MQTRLGATGEGPASAICDECISFPGLFTSGKTPQQCAALRIFTRFGFARHDACVVLAFVAPRYNGCYWSNGKIRFQSFFMLITIQPFLFASVIKASEKVPT